MKKLTYEQITEIRKSKKSTSKIAKEYGVSDRSIYYWLKHEPFVKTYYKKLIAEPKRSYQELLDEAKLKNPLLYGEYKK